MKVVLVGAGGYGFLYVDFFLGPYNLAETLEGIVEPYFDTCPAKERIENAGIPVYASLEDFYSEHDADLAVIVTPPFLHYEQSLCALQHQSYVLCEKPVASTMEEAQKMLAVEQEYGKFLAIGYQWSYSTAIQKLKQDILDGKLGKPLSLKTIVSWPRDKAYYRRGGGWGGRISKNGVLIYDSIASNACAHYIHNMLFLLGDDMNSSALPDSVEAECIRANAIETFDTCVLRMSMHSGAKLYFAATHAADRSREPEFVYEFENATLVYPSDGASEITAHWKDGTVTRYGDPCANNLKKLDDCIEAAKNGETPVCTVKTAIPHAALIAGIHRHVKITDFPEEMKTENDVCVSVPGLLDKMEEAYQTQSLLSEIGCTFAERSEFQLTK